MHIRSALALFASLSLFACTFDSPPPSGSSTSRQTEKEKGNGGSKGGAATGDEAGTAIDGTWDISVAGPEAIGPSEMTIQGGHVTGVIVMGDEGTGDDCVLEKNRMSFDLVITGDDLAGTFTHDSSYSGSCAAEPMHFVSKLEARRTHDAKNADGATAVEGDWQILNEDGKPIIAVNVAGLVAKAWDHATKTGSPVMTTNVTGNTAKNTASESTLAFAARKR